MAYNMFVCDKMKGGNIVRKFDNRKLIDLKIKHACIGIEIDSLRNKYVWFTILTRRQEKNCEKYKSCNNLWILNSHFVLKVANVAMSFVQLEL